MSKELAKAIRVTADAYYRVREMIEKDDGAKPERSRRLQRAVDALDARLEGLEDAYEILARC